VRDTISAGSILVKDDTIFPTGSGIKTDLCVLGWKLVRDLDGYGMDRVIENAGWSFFCHASEVRAGSFGMNGPKMICRAITEILKNPQLERFNALEIAKVSSSGSIRFPGIWHVTVSAHARHIQQGLFLFAAKDSVGRESPKGGIPGEIMGLTNAKTPALSF
jgi:hypothetical protein